MIKKLIHVDLSNIMYQNRQLGRRVDLRSLRTTLANPEHGQFCMDMKIYASLPHENSDKTYRFHDALRHEGFQVIAKRAKKLPDGTFKCNLDIEFALGALNAINMVHQPDSIVLVTGDGDFAPLCCELRNKGFFVEVAGIANCVAGEIKAAAQGFIDLTEWAAGCEKLNADAPEVGGNDIFNENLF